MRSPLLKKEITTMANKKKLAKTTRDDRQKRRRPKPVSKIEITIAEHGKGPERSGDDLA